MTRPLVYLLPAALILAACGDRSRGTQPAAPPAGSEISFADSALTAAVVEALEAAHLPQTAAGARTLSQLTASDRGIEDLTGLELLAALRVVDLSYNRIEDVTPLAGLPSLKALNLTANRVVDAGPLASLPALEVLVLDDNLVEEIGAFLESAALRVLGLSGNPLSSGSLARFEELAARGVEVEYLHGPPAPGDEGDTFAPPPVPPETDWRILVETGLESPGRRGGNVLYSLGPDGALARITGRRGLTLGVDVSSDGRWLARCLWPTGGPSGVSFLLLLTPGEAATRVDTDGDWSITPAFSPDGRSLAYASGSPEHTDLFLYTMDSGASSVLVNDVGSASHPTWSPDGRRLAFSAYEGDSDAELYTLDLSTNVVTRLTYNEAQDDAPAWSPAGGQLAFRSDRDGNLDLYVLDLASGQVRRLTDLAGHAAWPHWSPDGERLVFSSIGERFGLHEIDAGGGEARPLTDEDLSLYATGWTGRLDPAFGTALRSGLFADDALDQAVRLAAGRAPSEPFSEDDLTGVLQMRTLSPVFDLQGIGRLASLSVLHLWFESRVDLGPLAALPGLTELYLRGGRLDDLGPLAGVSTLEILRMSGVEVADLSALSGMSLRRLEILDNPLLDLTTLGPAEVRGLSLIRCEIEDLSPLASLSSVLTLDLSGNEIVDVSPLARMSSVAILNLDGNRISDVSPLLELPLRQLRLTDNPLSRASLDIHVPAMRARGTLVSL